MLAFASIKHEITGAVSQRIFDECARQAQPCMLIHEGTLGSQRFDAGGDGLPEPDVFEQRQRRVIDALHVALTERAILATFHTGAHGSFLAWDGPRSQRLAGFASAAPP